jgi:1,4-dihydroxy-2-naphthoate octaprenyltransferase
MLKHWLQAFRLRTLPLALSCIILGALLAKADGVFQWSIFILAALTTIFLQVLSNLANDYGDTQNGADNAQRVGPTRAVQSGAISATQMKKAIIIFVVLSLSSGISLIYISLKDALQGLIFLGLGVASIAAAIKYTAGKNPYGYRGFGDLFVFLFFGVLGIFGSYYLFNNELHWRLIFPACSIGFLSAAVLNLNNMRDRIGDAEVGKRTIPVILGKQKSKLYHLFLLSFATYAAIGFVLTKFHTPWQFLFALILPIHILNLKKVFTYEDPKELDPELKKIALSTLLFAILLGLGNLL